MMLITSSPEIVNKWVKVKNNETMFSIRLMEDIFRFSAYKTTTDNVIHSDEEDSSNNSEDLAKTDMASLLNEDTGVRRWPENEHTGEHFSNSKSRRQEVRFGGDGRTDCNLPISLDGPNTKYNRDVCLLVIHSERNGGTLAKVNSEGVVELGHGNTMTGPDESQLGGPGAINNLMSFTVVPETQQISAGGGNGISGQGREENDAGPIHIDVIDAGVVCQRHRNTSMDPNQLNGHLVGDEINGENVVEVAVTLATNLAIVSAE